MRFAVLGAGGNRCLSRRCARAGRCQHRSHRPRRTPRGDAPQQRAGDLGTRELSKPTPKQQTCSPVRSRHPRLSAACLTRQPRHRAWGHTARRGNPVRPSANRRSSRPSQSSASHSPRARTRLKTARSSVRPAGTSRAISCPLGAKWRSVGRVLSNDPKQPPPPAQKTSTRSASRRQRSRPPTLALNLVWRPDHGQPRDERPARYQ